ncbi:MAG TPA: S8 family serine peptidase [Gaiellaceae bacterium]|nr:S8 family serine peptidase [Gaiellaceae bacterium]
MRRLALALAVVGLALPAGAAGSASFVPNDPLAARQWYLGAIHAFDFWPEAPVDLSPVRVAIIDSGLDVGHPEFAGRVVGQQSFVGGDVTDRQGHGTFVAGIIAASIDNGSGIAGIAFPAQLLVAKVVRADGTISPGEEAKAIRWAADNGARVINLSLGGLRDPLDPAQDTFSESERSAVAYAYAKGAVVVAAVGNADEAPKTPWHYASYPAALPHVIGVSAIAPDGSVPAFSIRDKVYNDISAPGVGIVSTLPRSLTATHPTCADQGYSLCGPAEFRPADGTSYAAAQVSAAAALVIAARPWLAPDQVTALLEHTAADVNAASGCLRCPLGRDWYSGWGRLDVAAALKALTGPIPPRDRYEANDEAGTQAFTLYGRSIDVSATLDYWDDNIDVYRVRLRKGQTVSVSLRGPAGTDTNLVLWRPGTQAVDAPSIGRQTALQAWRVTQSAHAGPNEHFLHRARQEGWYYVEVKLTTQGSGGYRLHISKSPA